MTDIWTLFWHQSTFCYKWCQWERSTELLLLLLLLLLPLVLLLFHPIDH